MLSLKNIVKEYSTGDSSVRALDGVSLDFRKSEFVSILGPSGCGKTTLLNIIGGLDQYTSGDLIINGVSTKKYKDADWDTYRNHSIGFVFQNQQSSIYSKTYTEGSDPFYQYQSSPTPLSSIIYQSNASPALSGVCSA